MGGDLFARTPLEVHAQAQTEICRVPDQVSCDVVVLWLLKRHSTTTLANLCGHVFLVAAGQGYLVIGARLAKLVLCATGGSNVGEVIKTGTSSALVRVTMWNTGEDGFKPEVYGPQVTIERRIHLGGSSTWRMLDYFKNVVS